MKREKEAEDQRHNERKEETQAKEVIMTTIKKDEKS